MVQQAKAANVPLVSPEWILRCDSESTFLPDSGFFIKEDSGSLLQQSSSSVFLLPDTMPLANLPTQPFKKPSTPFPVIESNFTLSKMSETTQGTSTAGMLTGQKLLLVAMYPDEETKYSTISRSLGAITFNKEVFDENPATNEASYVICGEVPLDDSSFQLLKYAERERIPIVTSEWLTQCLVLKSIPPPQAHRYKIITPRPKRSRKNGFDVKSIMGGAQEPVEEIISTEQSGNKTKFSVVAPQPKPAKPPKYPSKKRDPFHQTVKTLATTPALQFIPPKSKDPIVSSPTPSNRPAKCEETSEQPLADTAPVQHTKKRQRDFTDTQSLIKRKKVKTDETYSDKYLIVDSLQMDQLMEQIEVPTTRTTSPIPEMEVQREDPPFSEAPPESAITSTALSHIVDTVPKHNEVESNTLSIGHVDNLVKLEDLTQYQGALEGGEVVFVSCTPLMAHLRVKFGTKVADTAIDHFAPRLWCLTPKQEKEGIYEVCLIDGNTGKRVSDMCKRLYFEYANKALPKSQPNAPQPARPPIDHWQGAFVQAMELCEKVLPASDRDKLRQILQPLKSSQNHSN